MEKNKTVKNGAPLKNKIKTPGLSKSPLYSYSPSINNMLLSKKSLSPIGIDAKKCKDVEIYDKKNLRCINWDTNRAKEIALRNLRSNKKITCRKIYAPKQFSSNCWFNSLLITFFVSDLGRKYNRWLRESMITFVMADGKNIDLKLQKPFFLFNKYIESCIRPDYDESNFSLQMNTNNIIKNIFTAIHKDVNIKKGQTLIDRVGKSSNPLSFYKGLYNFLGNNLMPWVNPYISNSKDKMNYVLKQIIDSGNNNPASTNNNKILPKVVFLEIIDNASKKFVKKKVFKVDAIKNGNMVTYTYSLDSIVLRNTAKHHFSAYITCNGKAYAFDGMHKDKNMLPFDWVNKLNKNTNGN
jgi:hypothetical protein